jgi:3-deoxy-7-phosphoheptulonate synthase
VQIADILHGRDDRLVVIAGPCSIHDPSSALAYAGRLADQAALHRGELVVVMRTYFEKPRTLLGWKGYLNDPDLDGRCDVSRGIELSRGLLCAIGELGLPCASELLDPIATPYLEELLSWAAVGARTATSQIHRELASGLTLPVGIKNTPDGDIGAGVEGALAARSPHTRLAIDASGRAAVSRSNGNPDAHVVLRGGGGRTNHGPEDVKRAAGLAAPLGLAKPLMVDCSHANCRKDHRRQPGVCRQVLTQVAAGQHPIAGLMLESHLEEGRQRHTRAERPSAGQSITDPCIGWKQTEALLAQAAAAVRSARTGR